jgi:hypothetical protein
MFDRPSRKWSIAPKESGRLCRLVAGDLLAFTGRKYMEDNQKKTFFWPAADTEQSAKKLLRYGVVAALFTAGVTALAAAWAMGAERKAFNYIGAGAFLDVALFLAVAFGIYKGSRIAAVGGLLLFLAEKAYQLQQTGNLQGAWMAVILIVCYVFAIRGTFSLHRLRQQPRET